MDNRVDKMATVTPEGSEQTGQRARRWADPLKSVLDRPLTSYHMVLGATGLLLVLGLMMVLSASSVLSYKTNGNS